MQCGSLLNFIVKFLTRLCLIHFGLRDFIIRFHKLPLLNDNDSNGCIQQKNRLLSIE